MIVTAKLAGTIDGNHVGGRCDDADDRGIATRIATAYAGIVFGDVGAHRAQANSIDELEQGFGELANVTLGCTHEVKRETGRGFLADAGKPGQTLNQACDGISHVT